MPGDVQPTEAQAARAERCGAILRRRQVPACGEPLYAEDDGRVVLRTPAEVARRALVLLAVVQRAEAAPRDMVLKRIGKLKLWDAVSPSEMSFLQCEVPDEPQSRRLVWRLECIWVLMWALGHVEELGWPTGMCDVPRLGRMLHPKKGIAHLVGRARLRPKAEILDALDLTMRFHGAIRDARKAGRPLPANLDWSQPEAMVPPEECPAGNIVPERLRALCWLTRFREADWDDLENQGEVSGEW